MKKKLVNILLILLIILLSLPLIFPFLRNGFFTTHDGEWAIIRLSAYNFALKDGQIPPRWAGNLFHSYGYPVLNFNYPLPSMIGEIFHLLGVNFVTSVKAVFILSVILSAIFIYLFLREFFNKKTAFFGTILYLYYPFRMVDLFVRGSIGESLSFATLPLVYWVLVKLKKYRNKKWLCLSSLGLACLILAHNGIAFISLPFILIFMVVNLIGEKKHLQLLYCYIAILLLGLGLACFFWFPALYEKQWTILKPEIITKPTEHFPSLTQLIIPSWGYGQSKANDSLSFQFGPVHFILFILSLRIFFLKKRNKVYYFFLLASLVNIFFLLSISAAVWQKIPLMAFISYPWRLLVPLGFYFSVIGSFVFFRIKQNQLKIPTILFVFVILFFLTRNYRQPISYINRDEMFYITNQGTTIEGDENTPLWVKIPPKNAPLEKIEIDGEYKIEKQKSNLLQFTLNVVKPQKAIINTIYYPGWHLFVDNKERKIDYQNNKGIITFDVFPGEKSVKLIFRETSLRLIADFITLASIFGLLILMIRKNEKIS